MPKQLTPELVKAITRTTHSTRTIATKRITRRTIAIKRNTRQKTRVIKHSIPTITLKPLCLRQPPKTLKLLPRRHNHFGTISFSHVPIRPWSRNRKKSVNTKMVTMTTTMMKRSTVVRSILAWPRPSRVGATPWVLVWHRPTRVWVLCYLKMKKASTSDRIGHLEERASPWTMYDKHRLPLRPSLRRLRRPKKMNPRKRLRCHKIDDHAKRSLRHVSRHNWGTFKNHCDSASWILPFSTRTTTCPNLRCTFIHSRHHIRRRPSSHHVVVTRVMHTLNS